MLAAQCTIQERAGFIVSNRDTWWRSTDHSEAAMVAEAREVVSADEHNLAMSFIGRRHFRH